MPAFMSIEDIQTATQEDTPAKVKGIHNIEMGTQERRSGAQNETILTNKK